MRAFDSSKNTPFQQQQLRAWRPLLTPRHVLPVLIIVGILFIPLGVFFLYVSSTICEVQIDYTDCLSAASGEFSTPSFTSDFQWRTVVDSSNRTLCEVKFSVAQDIPQPVFLYYQLTNYYQNYRLYLRSVEPSQLAGQALTYSQLSSCDPLIGPSGFESLGDARPVYYPCGLIANSFFNDTIGNPVSESKTAFSFSDSNIVWRDDLQKYAPTSYSVQAIVAPPFWRRPDLVFANGTYKAIPDLSKNERFINWMRIAGLPTFRKLYGRADASLPAGTYTITIDSVFEVAAFGGTKAIVLSNVSFLGGKNSFLGLIYLIIGSVFLAFGILFLACHVYAPRAFADVKYLSWNKNK